MRRRSFLAGLVATAAGLLVPAVPTIIVPERRYWALDHGMVAVPDDRVWLRPDGTGPWMRTATTGDAVMRYMGIGDDVSEVVVYGAQGTVHWVAAPGAPISSLGGRLVLDRAGYRATIRRPDAFAPLLRFVV